MPYDNDCTPALTIRTFNNGTTFMSTAGQLLHIARASGASVFTVYAVYLGQGSGSVVDREEEP